MRQTLNLIPNKDAISGATVNNRHILTLRSNGSTPVAESTASLDSPSPTTNGRSSSLSTLLRVSLRVWALLLFKRLGCSGVSKMSSKSSGTQFPLSKLCFWMRRNSRPRTTRSKIGLESSRMPSTKPMTCWMTTPLNFYGNK